MPLSPAVRSRYDSTVRHCTHSLLPFLPSPTSLPVGNPLAYERRPMRRREGEDTQQTFIYVQLQAYCSFLRSRARTQINQTSSSRVLRIRAARSWVKIVVCVSPRSALCAASAPRQTEKGFCPHR